jgi:alpha-tubulin suppressor-like RCC1 family protein
VCWARGGVGQLGGGTFGAAGNPAVTVASDLHWTAISVGRLTTCGLSESGTGYCWGINQHGEVGASTVAIGASSSSPVPVEGGLTFKAIATGWLHACGITTAGAAYCWGANNSGQLGSGADTLDRRSPTAVSGGLTFTQISLGSRYTCGLTTDGSAYCWGDNGTGQLGDGTLTARVTPTPVAGGRKFSQIAAGSGFAAGANAIPPVPLQGGSGHTCALTTAGQPYCWGWNGDGEIGDGTTVDKLTPTAVGGGLTFGTIAVGGAYSCGMQGDNVWCWGSNRNGQIGRFGDGSLPVTAPVRVLSPFGGS